jgi:hypothetical protein
VRRPMVDTYAVMSLTLRASATGTGGPWLEWRGGAPFGGAPRPLPPARAQVATHECRSHAERT